ncbi:(2Fe-2S)-binding protein [Cohnella lubricantis]|uniref:Ferric siderophore reductase C-terminal domain-containing protein n=1 Tax=Cohnella lubricantis TaxID=2163172 RepID=A0A841T5D0_9BACL|nr:(2Fe-2S)-binding protein [Cohnella lubricantis]MBB6676072.1 hypothetical protein [Cohnella lubricantis]MBP2118027.1 ferric iron reductase protein FhuF [Cohnella lubricantis]
MTSPYDFSLAKYYFHISPEGVDHLIAEMPAAELLGGSRLKDMIQSMGEMVQAFDMTLPASFFGTSLCHLCLVKLQFLAQYNVILDLSLERLTFQVDYEESHGHPHLGFRINEVATREIPSENGDAAVREDWEAYARDVVTPAVEAVAQTAGMKPEMIWPQFGGLAAMMQDFVQQSKASAETNERFEHHLQLLTESISPEAFHQKRSPFKCKVRYVENFYEPGEKWVMRSACCLYDRREGGEKCYICPRRTDQEREEMKERLLAEANAK